MSLNKILLGLCILLMLTACGPTTPQNRVLFSGPDGVKLSVPDQNNYQQFENETFTIAIRLENDGAADITANNTGLMGATFDKALISFIQALDNNGQPVGTPAVPFILAGRSKDVNVGEVKYAEFTFNTVNLTGREKATTPITFQACYPYTTTFIKNICVDRDIYNTEATKLCYGTTISDSTQGAPVAVTTVEPRYVRSTVNSPTGNKGIVQPQYKIHIENIRGGYVLWSTTDSTTDKLCKLDTFQRNEYGKVRVDASLNNVPLVCGSDNTGIARFDRTGADITCKLTTSMDAGSNYETPLIIHLHYFYISSLTVPVEVTR